MLDVFKDEFLKTYDKQHPRVNHRGLLVQDERAGGYDEEQFDNLMAGPIMKRLIGIQTMTTMANTSARRKIVNTSIGSFVKMTMSSKLPT